MNKYETIYDTRGSFDLDNTKITKELFPNWLSLKMLPVMFHLHVVVNYEVKGYTTTIADSSRTWQETFKVESFYDASPSYAAAVARLSRTGERSVDSTHYTHPQRTEATSSEAVTLGRSQEN